MNVGVMKWKNRNGRFFKGELNGAGLSLVARRGRTQYRLRYELDDDDDGRADRLYFFSGEARRRSDRPTLVVYYTLP
ncbi:MAG: hypothetical protein HY784_03530 [Chloroflexi bacterium]|nr:hypothetical protein [Chloroflexota bacterium]